MSTPTTIPDSDAFNWVIAPAGRCVSMVCEGAHTASLLHRALLALTAQGPLLVAASSALRAAGRSTQAIQKLMAGQSVLEGWAKEVLGRDLHDLHTSGAIALWSSLELAVEDTVTLILMRDSTVQAVLVGQGVKLPGNLTNPLTEIDARRIFSKFEKKACETQLVSQAYCHILESVGLAMQLDPGVHSILNELNYARNCLLHRGGIVDGRAAREAPGLQLCEGDSIRIGQAFYLSYFDAAGKFATALLSSALASRHARIG